MLGGQWCLSRPCRARPGVSDTLSPSPERRPAHRVGPPRVRRAEPCPPFPARPGGGGDVSTATGTAPGLGERHRGQRRLGGRREEPARTARPRGLRAGLGCGSAPRPRPDSGPARPRSPAGNGLFLWERGVPLGTGWPLGRRCPTRNTPGSGEATLSCSPAGPRLQAPLSQHLQGRAERRARQPRPAVWAVCRHWAAGSGEKPPLSSCFF